MWSLGNSMDLLRDYYNDSYSHDDTDVKVLFLNGDLWRFYQWGLVTGVVLVMTLSLLFPPQQQQQQQKQTDSTTIDSSTMSAMSARTTKAVENANNGNGNEKSHITVGNQESTRTPPWPKQQQQQSVPSRTTTTANKRNNETKTSSSSSSSSGSPHAQMNAIVYVILIGTAVYTLNQEYHGILWQWFQQVFPREASLLSSSYNNNNNNNKD